MTQPAAELPLGTRLAQHLRLPHVAALLVAAGGLAAWAAAAPRTPDLAAQVARASLVRATGMTGWWLGWFGGLQLPTYSVLAPALIACTGAWAAGAFAAVASVLAMTDLLRGTHRRAAGAVTFALLAVLDVAAGRLTFALGFAAAMGTLAALRRRSALALPAAVACLLLSLLAAFFLGVAALAVTWADPTRRRWSAALTVLMLGGAAAAQVLFPQTGTMPAGALDIAAAAATALLVAWMVPEPVVRTGALGMMAAPLVTALVPGALGDNVVRLTWLVATPVVVAMAREPRTWLVWGAAAAVGVWPVVNSAEQLHRAADPSASAAFYAPLATELRSQIAAAGPAARGERLEVIPTRTHWESSYLAAEFQLARGWDRQADVADNPVFYGTGTLTGSSYGRWLHEMAVGWVAVPSAPLDMAGSAEGALVAGDLPLLHLVWRSPSWRLYRVEPAAPLARGAAVVGVQPSSVTLRYDGPGTATVALRWNPYLVATAANGEGATDACVAPHGEFVSVTAPSAGLYELHSAFRVPAAPCRSRSAPTGVRETSRRDR